MLNPSGKFIVELGDPGLVAAIRSGLAEVEVQLRQAVTHSDDFITKASRHLIEAGGKRFRPFMTLLAAGFGQAGSHQGAGTGPDGRPRIDDVVPYDPNVIQAAVAIELIHLASLHHDDVLDEATIRRGAPSVNTQYTNRIAILTGDYLVAQTSLVFARLGLEAIQLQSEITSRLVTGQIQETLGLTDVPDPVQRYLDIVADKTGALIGMCGTLGATFSGASPDVVKTLSEYGEAIGIAFQISDDLLDITSEVSEFGKTAGTDLREGVRTLPVLYALAGDDPAEARLRDLVSRPLTDDAEHAEALALLRRSPAIAQAYGTLDDYATRARTLLGNLPETPARAALYALVDFVINRTR